MAAQDSVMVKSNGDLLVRLSVGVVQVIVSVSCTLGQAKHLVFHFLAVVLFD